LLALLAFWIVNSLLVPRLAADAAERLHPAPNAKIFWEAVSKDLKEGIDGHNTRDQRVEKLKQQVLAQYQVARVEDLPVNFSGISLQAGEEYGNQVFDKHVGELWETYARQENVHSFAALAAPFMALRAWSMGLSGTDLGQHRHFVTAAENYRRALNKMMNEDLTYNSKIQGYNYFAQRDLWEKSPDFVYAAPALGWVLREQSWSAAALLCWLLLAAAAAFFAARRMKV
jgi:ABC-2 type transport system permease protein